MDVLPEQYRVYRIGKDGAGLLEKFRGNHSSKLAFLEWLSEIAEALQTSQQNITHRLEALAIQYRGYQMAKITFQDWISGIAKACGCDQTTVSREIETLMHLVSENQKHQSAASHATDFDPPLYNIWKQQDKSSQAVLVRQVHVLAPAPQHQEVQRDVHRH
jgi:hypothetical protein